MTRVFRGGLPAPSFLLPLRSRARYSRFYPPPARHEREIYPFLPQYFFSVSLLSGGEGGIGGRKVLPLVYITFTVATATTTTTTTIDHRHHLHHLHVVVELVYTQRWGFCRFDKVVSRTQSSTARPSKFGAPIRDLHFVRPCRNLAFGLFWNYYSFFIFFFLFYLVSSELFSFFPFLFRVSFWFIRMRKCVNVKVYVHGGDTRRRHVFRNALVHLVPSTFQSCRECSVSKQFIV